MLRLCLTLASWWQEGRVIHSEHTELACFLGFSSLWIIQTCPPQPLFLLFHSSTPPQKILEYNRKYMFYFIAVHVQ